MSEVYGRSVRRTAQRLVVVIDKFWTGQHGTSASIGGSFAQHLYKSIAVIKSVLRLPHKARQYMMTLHYQQVEFFTEQ